MDEKVIQKAKELAEKYISAGKLNSEEEAKKLVAKFPELNEEQKKTFVASFVFPNDSEFINDYNRYNHSANKLAQLSKCSANTVFSKVFIVNKIHAMENKPSKHQEETGEKTIEIIKEPVELGEEFPTNFTSSSINKENELLESGFDKDERIKNLEQERDALMEENIALGTEIDDFKVQNNALTNERASMHKTIEELNRLLGEKDVRIEELESFIKQLHGVFQANSNILNDTDPNMGTR